MTRRNRSIAVVALFVLGLALVPVFQANLLAPANTDFFTNWDRQSQALVLSKIEQDQVGSKSSRFGLVAANPDPLSPYATFDSLHYGARPTATSYSQHASSLGLQGFAFEVAYRAGCSTLNCLNSVESTAFSLVFVLFASLIGIVVRRALGLTVLFVGLASPWVVSSAHNLYWVPWTWLLPACAAASAMLARRRRWRIVWMVAAGAATALKCSTGYEYLSTTTLLAASIPVLAWLLSSRTSLRVALKSAVIVFGSCAGGLLIVLVIHMFVAGGGAFFDGAQFVIHDALHPQQNASAQASTASVLAPYIVGWTTPVLAIGVGGPYPALALGPGGFWALSVGVAALIAIQWARRDTLARRNAAIYLVGLVPPLSWLVLAKSHSFTETNENYVLWYLIFIPILVWLLFDGVRVSTPVQRISTMLTSSRTNLDSTDPDTGR